MAKQTERHDIAEGLYIYKQANSKRWYARFVLENKWYAKATKEKDQNKAIIRAIELQTEYRIMLSNNIPIIQTKKTKQNTFSAIVDLAIKRMELALEEGAGKEIFSDYIGALRKYHKTYFDNILIKDINRQKLIDFDEWRIKQLGRVPAKSTILTHNSAMQRVFDEAVIKNILTQSELPALKNTGKSGERRAAFTKDEYNQLLTGAKKWIEGSRKQVTKEIRQLMFYYMQFAVLTGMRPGKEIDYLSWGDIHYRTIKNQQYTTVTVKKGKTTKYTGTREIVCKDEIANILNKFRKLQKHTGKNDLIFVLPNGDTTNEIGVNFRKLLVEQKLKRGAHGERTLYSLRHTYITWQLEEGIDMQVIATQCGTSKEMIERHYNHVVPSIFAEQLAGKQLNMDDLSKLTLNDDTGTLVIKDGVVVVEY